MYRLFLAFRYLRSRLVNLISVGGVMAGVAVLISVVAIMDGFQARVRKVVRGTLSHIILTPTADPEELPPFRELEASLKRTDPNVVAAAPHIIFPVFYPYTTAVRSVAQIDGQALHQMEADGIDWRHERQVSSLEANLLAAYDPERPFFHPFAAEREKTTVLVSRTFAERFHLGGLDDNGRMIHRFGALNDDEGAPLEGQALLAGCRELIGQEVKITWPTVDEDDTGQSSITGSDANLIITGVYDNHDAAEDNVRIYVDIVEARRMTRQKFAYLRVNVRLNDYENADAVKENLYETFGNLFIVETWEDQKADFLRAVNNEKVMLVIVLSFIVLLGGFIILATLTMTVVEKTRDIGIVGALGAAPVGILSIFVWNGLLIGLFGAVLGLGLGAWFTDNVNAVHAAIKSVTGRDVFPPDIYHFRDIPTVWSWASAFSIMGGSVVIAFLAGVLPALRAARLDPVRALRYE